MNTEFNSNFEINPENLAKVVDAIQADRDQKAFLIIGENSHKVVVIQSFKGSKIPEGFRRVDIEETSSIAKAIFNQFLLENVLKKTPNLKGFTWHQVVTIIRDYITSRTRGLDASNAEISLDFAKRLSQEATKAERLYFNAIRSGNAEDLRHLMQLGVHPDSSQGIYTRGVTDKFDKDRGEILSPMQIAAAHGNRAVIEQLLRRAEDITVYFKDSQEKEKIISKARMAFLTEEDANGNTLLHYAVETQNKETFIYLAEELNKIDPEFLKRPNKSGFTPLKLAVSKNWNEIINEIFKTKGLFKVSQSSVDSLLDTALKNENLALACIISPYASRAAINSHIVNEGRRYPQLFEVLFPLSSSEVWDKCLPIAVQQRNFPIIKTLLPKQEISSEARLEGLKAAASVGSSTAVRMFTQPPTSVNLTDALAKRLAIITVSSNMPLENGRIEILNKFIHAMNEKDKNLFLNSLATIAASKGNIELTEYLTRYYKAYIGQQVFDINSQIFVKKNFDEIADIIVQNSVKREGLVERYIPSIKKEDIKQFFNSLLKACGKRGDTEFTDYLKEKHKVGITYDSILEAIDAGQLSYIQKYVPLKEGIPDANSMARHAALNGHSKILEWVVSLNNKIDFKELLEDVAFNCKVNQIKIAEFVMKNYVSYRPNYSDIKDMYSKLNSKPNPENYEIRKFLWDKIPNNLIKEEEKPPQKS